MAIIGEIRKRPGILVGVIALSIVLFLIGVAVNDQFSVLRPGRGTDAGSVDGQAIAYNDYTSEVADNVKNVEAQNHINLTDVQRNYMNQQTWNDMVNDIVMQRVSDKTGVTVSDDEMVSLTMTENLHPLIRQQIFGNGPVDVASLNALIKNLNVDDKGQEPGAKRKLWNNLVKQVKKSQLQSKYNTLIMKSIGNVPKWMAEEYYEETNKTADFRYVELPYAEVNDNEIKYTDADLKEYLNKNAAKFKATEETRTIQYVAFNVVPSSVDSATALKSLTDKLEEFKKGATKSDDSLFVKLYSETPMYDLYSVKGQPNPQAPAIADSLYDLPVGTVVGPYVENGVYKFAKVSEKKMMSDSVRVREIEFSYNNVKSEDEFKAKLALFDSLYTLMDSLHGDFAALAAANSDNPAAKMKGGDIGWVKLADNQLDDYYKSIVFHNGQVGKVYKYYQRTENGQYIPSKLIEVTETKPSLQGVKVAFFTRQLAPSQETETGIYSDAMQFVQNNNTEDKWKKYAAEHPTMVKHAANITKESYDVDQLSARSLVKWVFDAKRGDISPVKSVDDGSGVNGRKYVVAYLESVNGEGTPGLESVKEQVKMAFLKEKKYELLAKKISDAKASNIDDLATKLGKQVQEAPNSIFANPNLPSGVEPAVVAAGVYSAQGKLSGPVRGNQGVYAVQKVTGVDPPAPTDLTRAVIMAQQMAMAKSRSIQEALRKEAKVKDYRLNFEGNN
ncbi:MAG: SurA N-terminal domain-containing protein [Bacteroidetes bacterium]|nr:SurA N-terminal domain-containing protein [Bacteroidota bacterium]